ncbi:MAG: efflux RND transporter permease subunit, partial [Pseudomonadota bacterium]
ITLTAFSVVAGTGAVLLLSGMPLSPAVLLGGLILIGITAGQTSLFVTSAAGRSGQRQSRRQMLRRIAAVRFRPSLAVTFVALSGMMPLLFAAGAATVLHPVIIAVATGLLLSLPVNLFLFPSLYLFLERKEQSPGT